MSAQPSVLSTIAPTLQLAAEQVRHFQHQGFLAIRSGVAPAVEVPHLSAIYDQLFAEQAGRKDGRHFALFGNDTKPGQPTVHQILGPELYAPEMTRTATWANARSIFTALFGIEPASMSGHAICKPPHSPLATPWHQDEAYWHPGQYHLSASIWIPLQDVDEASGCMQFVPGSHLGEVLPHRPTGDDPHAQGLELEPRDWDLSNAVACPLSAGGCTVHGGRMLHYTGANRATVPRRAWIIMAGIPMPKRLIPAERPWVERMQRARAAAAEAAVSAL
jgi:hypothetical protein